MADNISFTEHLIEKVKEYPWLYDTARENFKDTIKKNNSWKEIADAFNVDVQKLEQLVQDVENRTHCACDNSVSCFNNTINDTNSSSNGFKIGLVIIKKLSYTRSRVKLTPKVESIQQYSKSRVNFTLYIALSVWFKNAPFIIYQRLRRQRAAMTFARNLRRLWKLGDCGNDALLFIVSSRKRLYITVGGSTDDRITESRLYQIRRSVSNYLYNEEFFEALSLVIQQMRSELMEFKPIESEEFKRSMVAVFVHAVCKVFL
ncbi:hypothetical protein GQR58_003709 [Nymphon striatum]|nr:hypothetical protein GQR58_003709 [Nymphon striatum]